MNVLDLFSGIGGFSLGLERAGMRTVAFCEIEPYCRAVLRKHWPDVPIYNDIRSVRGIRADVVTGGFPCQPFSTASAGKRYGERHNSYLWPEMLRVIQEANPSWVIGENVIGIESMALETVVSDLEAIGYEVAPPLEIPACAVGHDHKRNRIWILAHAYKNGESSRTIDAETPVLQGSDCNGDRMGETYGIPSELDKLRALGNAVVPQIPEILGRAILAAEAP